MIVVTIDPVAFSFGPVAVRWFGILAVLGIVLATGLAARAASRVGIPRAVVLDAAALSIPVGALCARVFHVLSGWDYYVTAPNDVWQINLGGLSLWGALVGGGLSIAWQLRSSPVLRARLADVAAPFIGLGIAIGSIGSFIDGDGLGTPSALPWAVQYTSEAAMVPDFGVPRHPVQLYVGLGALLLAGLVLLVPRSAAAGTRAWLFFAAFAALRIALSPLRLDASFLLSLQLDEMVAGLVLVWTILQLARAAVHSGMRRAATGETG